MKTVDQADASAIKLSGVLGSLGHDLKHVDSLEIISKLRSDPGWNSNTESVSKEQLIAEQCLDELLEAKSELNYAKFHARMDKEILDNITEKRFLRSMRNIREDYGRYVSRQYLGIVNNGHYSEPQDKYPGKVRHVWRGVFEKQERFITMGIYFRDGNPHVSGIVFW